MSKASKRHQKPKTFRGFLKDKFTDVSGMSVSGGPYECHTCKHNFLGGRYNATLKRGRGQVAVQLCGTCHAEAQLKGLVVAIAGVA